MAEKILLGSPTYQDKFYCIDAWMRHLRKIKSPNIDVLIVDNSKDLDYYEHIQRLGANFAEITHIESTGNPYEDVLRSRKKMIDKVLSGNYSHFFSLECDIFPQDSVLPQLLNHRLRVVGVPYILTYLLDDDTRLKTGYLYSCSSLDKFNDIGGKPLGSYHLTDEDLAKAPPLLQVYHIGLGCTLIEREVLARTPLRCDPARRRFDDSLFFQDLRNSNIPVFADTTLMEQVQHYPNFKKVVGWKHGGRKP